MKEETKGSIACAQPHALCVLVEAENATRSFVKK
mgnify:FL=1